MKYDFKEKFEIRQPLPNTIEWDRPVCT